MIKTKSFKFILNGEPGQEGTFSGLASVYGNVDSYSDVVERGAFSKTIKDHDGEIIILNQHKSDQPVGKGRLEDTERGLVLHGELNLDLALARENYSNLRKGILKGLSIGYNTIKERFDALTKTNRLLEIKLMEVSLVTFPANPLALVTDVKSLRDNLQDLGLEELRDLREQLNKTLALREQAEPPASTRPDPEPPSGYDPAVDQSVLALLAAQNQHLKGRLQWLKK